MHVSGKLTPADEVRPGGDEPNTRSFPFAFAALAGETQQVYLGSVPRGEYRLSYDLSWQTPTQPAEAEVRVRQGVPHGGRFVFVLLVLAAVPAGLGLYQLVWEARRWKDSNL
jgi:hypothetical protein